MTPQRGNLTCFYQLDLRVIYFVRLWASSIAM
jgi:hypothetical protein